MQNFPNFADKVNWSLLWKSEGKSREVQQIFLLGVTSTVSISEQGSLAKPSESQLNKKNPCRIVELP